MNKFIITISIIFISIITFGIISGNNPNFNKESIEISNSMNSDKDSIYKTALESLERNKDNHLNIWIVKSKADPEFESKLKECKELNTKDTYKSILTELDCLKELSLSTEDSSPYLNKINNRVDALSVQVGKIGEELNSFIGETNKELKEKELNSFQIQ